MKLPLRLALLGTAGSAALALAGPALASYAPKLIVGHAASAGATGSVNIDVSLAPTDDPTAKVTIYVPSGYVANPSAASGTQIGTLEAQAQAADLGGATLPLTGVVQAADANTMLTSAPGAQPVPLSAAAQQCTQTPTHAAYWLLVLSAAGQSLQVPLYVDATSGTETAVGAYKLQVCLPPPDVPAGTPDRAAFGAKLFHAKLTLTNVFTTPSTANVYVWRAVFTPYTPTAGTANAPGTVEVRSVALLPISVTLTAKYDTKTKTAKLSGTLNVAGEPAANVAVPIFAGKAPTLKALKRSGSSVKSDQAGKFTAARRITKTTYFIAIVGTGGDATQAGCAEQVAPLGVPCTNATFADLVTTSKIVKVVVPKAKKKK